MRLVRIAVVLGAVGILAAACSSYGDETTTPAKDDGGSSSSGSDDGGASSGQVFDAEPGDDGSVDPVPALACPNAGRKCVADAPDGWTGPLLVYDGDESSVPKCPPEMNVARVDTHRGFHAPTETSTCTSCSCLPGSGVTCKVALSGGVTATCDGIISSQQLASGVCVPIDTTAGYKVAVDSSGGSCNTNGGFPVLARPAWESKTRACGAPTLLRTGCRDGEICAPEPPAPFKAKHCVSKSGDLACPSGAYSEKILTNGVDDQRTCAGCACGTPKNNCTAQGQIWTASGACTGGSIKSLPATDCFTEAGSVKLLSATSITPSCDVTSQAAVTGDVAVGAPVTICCLP